MVMVMRRVVLATHPTSILGNFKQAIELDCKFFSREIMAFRDAVTCRDAVAEWRVEMR